MAELRLSLAYSDPESAVRGHVHLSVATGAASRSTRVVHRPGHFPLHSAASCPVKCFSEGSERVTEK